MPRDLAPDPTKTVFDVRRDHLAAEDWDRWADLVRDLTAHLVDRYGLDEVRDHWASRSGTRPTWRCSGRGTPEDYLRLYDVTVAAVRSVDTRPRGRRPGSAAAGGSTILLDHVATSGSPVDFVSTHTYGSPPLDLRPTCPPRPEGTPIWWTEWGPTPHARPPGQRHGVRRDVPAARHALGDGPDRRARRTGSPPTTSRSWAARPRLLHGGFGLLTVGNLRKPRCWALGCSSGSASRAWS